MLRKKTSQDSPLPRQRACQGVALLFLLSASKAFALITFDATNHLFVTGTAGLSWSSNVNKGSDAASDFTSSYGVAIDFARKSGIITLDASASFDATKFFKNSDDNSFDPTFTLSLQRERGRLTGSLQTSTFRESKADTDLHKRTHSWNFPLTLNLRYPVNSRYSLTSDTGYAKRTFEDSAPGQVRLANYADFTEGINLAYALTSKLSMTAGYRARFSQTSFSTKAQDHSGTIGFSGALLAKLRGNLSMGYQTRLTKPGGRAYQGINAAAAIAWNVRRWMLVAGRLSRDFSTNALAANTEVMTAGVDANLTLSRNITFSAGVTTGRSTFLDGPLGMMGRADRTYGWTLGVGYSMNEHLKLSMTYSHNISESNAIDANYAQTGVGFSASSRW
jgi:hypothetical protein